MLKFLTGECLHIHPPGELSFNHEKCRYGFNPLSKSSMTCCFYSANIINAEMSCGLGKMIFIFWNSCVWTVTYRHACNLVRQWKILANFSIAVPSAITSDAGIDPCTLWVIRRIESWTWVSRTRVRVHVLHPLLLWARLPQVPSHL